ncbi:S10 family peptidase [Fluviispira vulneris]|uniref:S10 family peptidase n=1 Tax=Fluviispira vulneris TaxID=2763012 RepID=UPI001644BB0A|nr:peptidase S1 [Fluviispira vulneris]
MLLYAKIIRISFKKIAISIIGFSLLASCGKNRNNNSNLNDVNKSTLDQTDDIEATVEKTYIDNDIYGSRANDSVTNASEGVSKTQHAITINGKRIKYTATAGHLVTVDPDSSMPNAKMFYIAYTLNQQNKEKRPVTFIYNGGPGSSAVWLLLGSFSPIRIKTSMPDYTPPAPYTIEENPDSLLDKTDLIFINPVGTGYSVAISPAKNKDFWGVDPDANSITAFIKRYLTLNNRWNSPKFLMGESYGTPRSAVTSYILHQNGIDLNGITLISSILDYSKFGNTEGLFPSLAANAWYHVLSSGESKLSLENFVKNAIRFSNDKYGPYLTDWRTSYYEFNRLVFHNPNYYLKYRLEKLLNEVSSYQELIENLATGYPDEYELSVKLTDLINNLTPMDLKLVQKASKFIGIKPEAIQAQTTLVFKKTPLLDMTDYFLNNLLADKGRVISIYDGRSTGLNTGIARNIRDFLSKDPAVVNVQGAYTAAWNHYLNNELKYYSRSNFQSMNSLVGDNWNYSHIDPTGRQRGGNSENTGGLYTAGDLAATMSLNPDLIVFQASGYYDTITPFYQSELDIKAMDMDPALQKNITIEKYPSGHMIYLDSKSRTAMKEDLSNFYNKALNNTNAMKRILILQNKTMKSLSNNKIN